MLKLNKKQKFLRFVQRDKYYRGSIKLTKFLYKKYLKTLYNTGRCSKIDILPFTSVRSKEFFTTRGWTEVDAVCEVSRRQSRGINFYSGDSSKIIERVKKRAQTFIQKTPEEIQKINRLKGKSWDPQYIAKKYNISTAEAQTRIDLKRQNKVTSYLNYLKSIGGHKREWSVRCKEYYTSRGATEEEAIKIIADRSDSRSISAIQRRYNVSKELALKIQAEVSQKCKNTFLARPLHERQAITLKRLNTHNRGIKFYSDASKKFFDTIVRQIKYPAACYYASKEYFIWDTKPEKSKISFYDFTIPEINLIIEYNGLLYHPRVQDSYCITVSDSVQRDEYKQRLAESNGFTVLHFWEKRDNIYESQQRMLSIINNKLHIKYEHQRSIN